MAGGGGQAVEGRPEGCALLDCPFKAVAPKVAPHPLF